MASNKAYSRYYFMRSVKAVLKPYYTMVYVKYMGMMQLMTTHAIDGFGNLGKKTDASKIR